MFKKVLIVLTGLCMAWIAQAQNAETRIGQLMSESRWFDLARELKATPADSVSPMLRQMAIALTHHYFNRPDSACTVLNDLLTRHSQEMGSNTLSMAMLLGMNLARTDHYTEAAELEQNLYDQLVAQGVDSAQTDVYRTLAQRWRALAPYAPLCRPLHPAGTYRIPMLVDDKTDQHALLMDGAINGRESQLLFDTGAGYNIISSQQARDYGLRLLETDMPLRGIGLQTGRYAIADTLHIGGTVWANVPFLIIDIQTGHAKADSIGKELPPVIGVPVMLRMQEVQIDFTRREFIIPATPTPNPLGESNLMRTDSEGLRLATTDEKGMPLYFHFDTGCYYTTLLPRWYDRHQAEVEAAGIPDTLRIAGVGGISITRSYILPHMTFRIGNGEAVLDSVTVDTGTRLHDSQPAPREYLSGEEDGTIGLDLPERFSRVILNLKEMYLEAIPNP